MFVHFILHDRKNERKKIYQQHKLYDCVVLVLHAALNELPRSLCVCVCVHTDIFRMIFERSARYRGDYTGG